MGSRLHHGSVSETKNVFRTDFWVREVGQPPDRV